jgi:hypothetical protein
MIFRGNNSLFAIDKQVFNNVDDFYYFDFLQSASLSYDVSRVSQKSLGNSITDKVIYSNNDLKLQLSYLQRSDFLQERMLGLNVSEDGAKTIFSNLKNNFFNKNAFFLIDESKEGEILTKITENDFTENMISILISNLFLENYSFSYSIGSLPRVDTSFSFEEIVEVRNLIFLLNNNNFFIRKRPDSGDLIKLDQRQVESLQNRTSTNLGKNITYQVINFSLDASESQLLNHPFVDMSTFLTGLIQNLNISVNLERNKSYFFNRGNTPTNRELLYPINGTLQMSGITSNFNKQSLSSFLQNDTKFSLKIAIGESSLANSDYSEIIVQNIFLENFSYTIDANQNIVYSMNASFESSEESGLIIKVINVKDEDLTYAAIRASGGQNLLPKGAIDTNYLRASYGSESEFTLANYETVVYQIGDFWYKYDAFGNSSLANGVYSDGILKFNFNNGIKGDEYFSGIYIRTETNYIDIGGSIYENGTRDIVTGEFGGEEIGAYHYATQGSVFYTSGLSVQIGIDFYSIGTSDTASDGFGGYTASNNYTTNGTFIVNTNLDINIEGNMVFNGTEDHYSNGAGGTYSIANYPSEGTLLLNYGFYNYIADGNGGYNAVLVE